jgi:predicted transcriptional regulator
MNAKVRKIEVDAATADTLAARAAARGVSVKELVAELAARDDSSLAVEAAQIAELDRRWDAVQAGRASVPHDDVVQWLKTWGTPAFKPWRE